MCVSKSPPALKRSDGPVALESTLAVSLGDPLGLITAAVPAGEGAAAVALT